MEVRTCNGCGVDITPEDIAVGGPVSIRDKVFCSNCAERLRQKKAAKDAASGTSAAPAHFPIKTEENQPSVDTPTYTNQFDIHTKIAAWVGGAGLLLLGLSPFFKWVSLGSGGVTGISGDGKIVLGLTVVAIAAFMAGVITRKRQIPILLCVQAWGTIVVFWMGGLIWKVGTIMDSPDIKDNPFAALFATQISPGTGLYLGLIGGIAVAGALGFMAVRRLLIGGNLRPYYITQGFSCVIGIQLALFVGPDRPSKPKGHRATPNITSTETRESADTPFPGVKPDISTKPKSGKPAIEGVELEPSLTGKRSNKGDFQEVISLDINWTARRIKKPIRAVKGLLHIMDLFGETKFAIGWTINRIINQGDKFTEKGFGFKYNQFMDSHAWVRNTDKKNIKLRFDISAVVYQDGSIRGRKENAPRNSILVPALLKKRFQKQDFQEFIWLDIEWETSNLKKATRAVKGILHITDVFGDSKLSINTTIDVPLEPGKPYTEKGVGFKYNQFMDSHSWVRATSKENMRLVFVPKAIIYADGTREDM